MLNVGAINEGFVLDHIPAGEGMEIYRMLGLDKLDCGVAIIRNATSSKMGRKDILQAECPIDSLDMNILDILGFIDHNITVNRIRGGKIVGKEHLTLPEQVKNIVHCKNPRCISTVEEGIEHIFKLCDSEKHLYRCIYCEQEYTSK